MNTWGARRYVIHVCPVCGNVSAHGKVDRLDYQRAPAWCQGSDARPYPGSHEPVEMERLEFVDE